MASVQNGITNKGFRDETLNGNDRKWSFVPAGVTYSWHNLNVFAEKQNFWGKTVSKAHILKDVTGLCKGGQLLAIMGSSGAGKTTLLNVLTYRSVNMKIEGDVRINGKAADPDTLMGISAYVQQVDLFTRVFTVREQLTFHAQLRIGKKVSAKIREERIKDVLQQLGLTKCADTLIGEPGRIKGISGGEKKRLAFACELITNPLLLLCDEPTSGIDSFMAENVMRTMRLMADNGRTVISTIHQPSSEVFAMFDRLLILAEGRVGFLGTVEQAHQFFNRIERPCPENFNPGDHFIYTLAVKAGSEDADREYIHQICDTYKENEGKVVEKMVVDAKLPPETNVLENMEFSKSPYRSSYKNQFLALLRRSFMDVVREPSVVSIKVCHVLFYAVLFGIVFWDLDIDSSKGVQNVNGLLFIFVTDLTYSIIYQVLTIFSDEMPLFLREHWNGLYRSDVYFITKNLVQFPIYLFIPIMFISISYYMIGLRPEARYFFADIITAILIANTAVAFGYMVSCLSSDYNSALYISTPLIFPLMLFGGLYMKVNTIPVYLVWMKYLSWFMYGFECFTITQWNNFTVEYQLDNTTIQVPVGDFTLDTLSFDPDDFSTNLWCMLALTIGYRLLAYLFLLLRTRRKN